MVGAAVYTPRWRRCYRRVKLNVYVAKSANVKFGCCHVLTPPDPHETHLYHLCHNASIYLVTTDIHNTYISIKEVYDAYVKTLYALIRLYVILIITYSK